MTDESTPDSTTNGFPIPQSRRSLISLLSSAIAMGAISGSVSADGSTENIGCTVADPEEQHNRPDGFEVRDLAFTDDEFRLGRLQFAPSIDGKSTRLFAMEGFEATVENDVVTSTDVDSVVVHEDFDETIVGFLDMFVDHGVSDRSAATSNVVSEYLDRIDARHFERLRAIVEREGSADALESQLQQNPPSDGGYAGGYVLILVLFILLVIIGAGFGVGSQRSAF